MASESQSDRGDVAPVEEAALAEAGLLITARVLFSAVLGGLIGVIVMLPLLVGIPQALGVFRAEPIINFAGLGMIFGIEPSFMVGILLFLLAGTVVLPLLFVVAGAFLPPKEHRNIRGVSFATMMWMGFIIAFWPDGNLVTIVLFLVFSLLSHWVYGFALGTTLDRLVGIPQHEV